MSLYIFLLGSVGFALANLFAEDRIVGGYNTDIEDHPHQVSIFRGDLFTCGGSLISEKYVVTAAHCGRENPEIYTALMGTSNLENDGVIRKIVQITIHPYYNISAKRDKDISIFELEEAVNFTNKIKPIQLPSAEEFLPDGALVNVTGFGSLYSGSYIVSAQLQVVEVNVLSHEECREIYSKDDLILTDSMICAWAIGGGKDSCQGDSGGPLTANSKLFGIVSWGIGCGDDIYPGVYSYVPKLRAFITDVTGL